MCFDNSRIQGEDQASKIKLLHFIMTLAAVRHKAVALLLLNHCLLLLYFLWRFCAWSLFCCAVLSAGIERTGLEVIKLEFIRRLKIMRNDWLLADTCLQAANHCSLFLV